MPGLKHELDLKQPGATGRNSDLKGLGIYKVRRQLREFTGS